MKANTLHRLIPACVTFDWAQVNNLGDVAYLLEHEIDLFEEGQDGALSGPNIQIIRKALQRVKHLRVASEG